MSLKDLIDDLKEEIVQKQLDLGKSKLNVNSYEETIKQMGEDIIDAMKYYGSTTIYKPIEGGTYSVSLPQGFIINKDGVISNSGFSEYDEWNRVAEEIAGCRHEWVNVGFHFDKWVCKKCDVNKGSNE